VYQFFDHYYRITDPKKKQLEDEKKKTRRRSRRKKNAKNSDLIIRSLAYTDSPLAKGKTCARR